VGQFALINNLYNMFSFIQPDGADVLATFIGILPVYILGSQIWELLRLQGLKGFRCQVSGVSTERAEYKRQMTDSDPSTLIIESIL
jgi:hypothetical protein